MHQNITLKTEIIWFKLLIGFYAMRAQTDNRENKYNFGFRSQVI